ncbi:MAG TPA: hypothetical protein VGI05_01985 [Streptosporangiaceae bacterium]
MTPPSGCTTPNAISPAGLMMGAQSAMGTPRAAQTVAAVAGSA